jgi:hypothetical protein
MIQASPRALWIAHKTRRNTKVRSNDFPAHARRVRAARIIAVAADLLQIALFPVFVPGAVAPWNDALDVVVAAALVWLLGWNWAFVPSFVAELVPAFDLVPTWTMAVLFATRQKNPESLPRDGEAD